IPCRSVGTFPVRFPSVKQPNDIGKHVDVSFPGNDPNNYFEWRANVKSKGRALLMLVLYSDVSENDAPTVIYEGSHIDVARLLSKEGDEGLTCIELTGSLDALPKKNKSYMQLAKLEQCICVIHFWFIQRNLIKEVRLNLWRNHLCC